MLALAACFAVAAQPKAKARIAAGAATTAATTALRGNTVLGKEKSDAERCQECHGTQGQGSASEPDGKFAKLAGQYPEYIVKQVRNFRTGERRHDVMAIMARSIDDTDAADIAAYFAAQDRMRGDGTGDSPGARQLYTQGDAARNIAACAECHGAQGQGKSAGKEQFPVIGGQDRRYLEKQLIEWRSGERRNSPGAVMNHVAKALTDPEIKALAAYIAGF